MPENNKTEAPIFSLKVYPNKKGKSFSIKPSFSFALNSSKYLIEKELGKGGNAVVHKGIKDRKWNRNTDKVVIKERHREIFNFNKVQITKRRAEQIILEEKAFENELIILQKLGRLRGYLELATQEKGNTEKQPIVIIEEYLGKTLSHEFLEGRFYQEMSPITLLDMASQFCHELQELHERYHYIHNDIKPLNMTYDTVSRTAYLIDLDSAAQTEGYFLSGEQSTKWRDVYSMGISLAEIFGIVKIVEEVKPESRSKEVKKLVDKDEAITLLKKRGFNQAIAEQTYDLFAEMTQQVSCIRPSAKTAKNRFDILLKAMPLDAGADVVNGTKSTSASDSFDLSEEIKDKLIAEVQSMINILTTKVDRKKAGQASTAFRQEIIKSMLGAPGELIKNVATFHDLLSKLKTQACNPAQIDKDINRLIARITIMQSNYKRESLLARVKASGYDYKQKFCAFFKTKPELQLSTFATLNLSQEKLKNIQDSLAGSSAKNRK